MTNGYCVAEGHTLQHRCIFWLLPQRFKCDGDAGLSYSERVRFYIVVCLCTKRFFGNGFLHIEVFREILDIGFALHQCGFHYGYQHLCQRDHSLGAVFSGADCIRKQVGVHIRVVIVMLHICEIFAVFDNHACVVAAPLMVNHIEVIPFKFAAPQVYERSCHAAEAGAYALGFCHREGFCRRVVRLAGKSVGRGCICKHALHCECR